MTFIHDLNPLTTSLAARRWSTIDQATIEVQFPSVPPALRDVNRRPLGILYWWNWLSLTRKTLCYSTIFSH